MGRPRTILVAFGLALSLAACGSYGGTDQEAATGDTGSPSRWSQYWLFAPGLSVTLTASAYPPSSRAC